jgi:hypothetical protein
VIAVTILASFLLPLMLLVTKSKVKAIKYTQQRELRDLAQRKLFDVIHYYEETTSGTFELEGRPEWAWAVPEPQMVGQGEQVLLEYAIQVTTPQKIDGQGASGGGGVMGDLIGELIGGGARGGARDDLGEGGSSYELRVWTFPDARWYEEQQILYERGEYSPLYDGPWGAYGYGSGGLPGAGLPGAGY